MPLIPWWTLLSSLCAPAVLICGWVFAAPLQPPGYNPMVQSISALAARGATDPWLMTGALFAAGVCHMVTGFGLRAAAVAGRIALICGGLAAIMVALSPEPADGGVSVRHVVATAIGFTALALFPVLAAVRGYLRNWTLRPATGYAVTALMTGCAAWFLLALHAHGDSGFVERLLTSMQSFWPLIVVVACLGTRLRAPAGQLSVTPGMAQGEKSHSEH